MIAMFDGERGNMPLVIKRGWLENLLFTDDPYPHHHPFVDGEIMWNSPWKNHRFVDVSIVRLSSWKQVAYLAPEILLGQKYGHTAGASERVVVGTSSHGCISDWCSKISPYISL